MGSFRAYLERWVATPACMLEVGVGSGALAAQLRERGHVATAIDPEATGGLDQREAGACGERRGVPGTPAQWSTFSLSFHRADPG